MGSLLLWNCEKTEEITSNSDLQDKTSTISKISLDTFLEENDITKQEIGFKNKKDVKSFNKKTDKPSFKINSKKVLSYINKKGKTIYILPLKKDIKDSLYTYNLVIKKGESNLEKYIYKYPKDKSKHIEISRIGKTNEHKSSSKTHRKGSTCETYHNYYIIPCPCVGHLDPYICSCPIRPEWIYLNSYQVCTVDNTDPDIEEPDSDADFDDNNNTVFFDNGCRKNSEGISECPPAEDNPDIYTPYEPLPMLTIDDIDGFDDFIFSDTLGLTDDQQKWINDEENKAAKDAITNYLNSFAITPKFENAKVFAYQSVLALFTNHWMTINNIDFDEQIINELTDKAKCVYDKLTESSTDFKNAIKKFDGEFPVSHLNLIMEDLGNTRGETRAPNGAGSSPDYVITIAINSNSNIHRIGYRPNLMTAKTIAHEVIHAEMFRKLLSVLDNGGNIAGVTRQNVLDALDGDFPGMYDYYRRHKNWQHQQMATHYRETIADVLKSFDNNQHSNQFYMDLAWEGLKYSNISTWSSQSQQEKDRINKVINDYINTNKNQPCQ